MTQLPPGWTGIPNGIATNVDPVEGGIIDKRFIDGIWFVIPNNDAILAGDGFPTQAEAFEYLNNAVKGL